MSDQPDEDVEYLDVQDIYDDMVGIWEIAKNLGVPISRVRRWVERSAETGCPRPVAVLHMGRVFSMRDWRGWHALWKVTRGATVYDRAKEDE